LEQTLGDLYRIQFGGKVVNIDNDESKQIDIILASKRTPKLFADKGIYPIESVFGAFSITSTMDHAKLLSDLQVFASIPRRNLQFWTPSYLSGPDLTAQWLEIFPSQTVFAFQGEIKSEWADEMHDIVEADPAKLVQMPEAVVVNKVGMIQKVPTGIRSTSLGRPITKRFHYVDFTAEGDFFYGLMPTIGHLYKLSTCENYVQCNFLAYFNRDAGLPAARQD
jgi:hypothetical protein